MPLLRSAPLLHVGTPLSPSDVATATLIPSLEQAEIDSFLESTPDGTVLRRWDFVSRYSYDSVLRPSEISPLRKLSDTLADEVVEHLDLVGKASGRDGLREIELYLERKEKELGKEEWEGQKKKDVVARLWDEMVQGPPGELDGVGEGKEKRYTPLEAFEDATPHPSLAEGQRVFWKHSNQIFTALMHFSLAGGFSSPKLSSVMRETNYLTSDAREATYKRLLETTLFVLDAMSDMKPVVGRGWRSAFRVRLLHAQVRRRIAKGKGRYNTYDEEADGVPINQADLVVVLGAFMIAPVWTLRRMGIFPSEREVESYQRAWVHVGYHLGISPSLLTRCYGGSFAKAESMFASLAYSIYPTGAPPSDPFSTPQYKILSAVCSRPPRGQPVEHHIALTRLCLGPKMADQLALPQSTLVDNLRVDVEVWTGWALLAFGQQYARLAGARGREWEGRRQRWVRRVLELLVVWQLGERRTTFQWREADKHHAKLTAEEGEEPGVEMGKHIGLAVKKEWASLLVEMGVVLGGVAVLTGGIVAGAAKYLFF